MPTLLAETRRRRGWTQDKLQAELRRAATRLGIGLPGGRESLRVMISGWEHGRHTPRDDHALLLQEVYRVPAEALGLAEVEDEATTDDFAVRSLLRRQFAGAGPEVVAYFSAQLTEHARMDNLTGPLFVLDTVVGQVEKVQALRGREAQRTAARFSEFAGWLLHDAGQTTKALAYTDRSVDQAEAAGDKALAVYNLMRKSNVLSSLGEHDRAGAVAQKATALAAVHAPGQLAVCLRQEALSAARLGDECTARDTFERALVLTEPTLGQDEHSGYCTTSFIHMEAALCWLTLGRPHDAAHACVEALASWPAELVRDEGLCWARLAVARLRLRQLDEATEAARSTPERVRSAPSARTLHMLQSFATQLAPYNQDRRIRELAREIAEVA